MDPLLPIRPETNLPRIDRPYSALAVGRDKRGRDQREQQQREQEAREQEQRRRDQARERYERAMADEEFYEGELEADRGEATEAPTGADRPRAVPPDEGGDGPHIDVLA